MLITKEISDHLLARIGYGEHKSKPVYTLLIRTHIPEGGAGSHDIPCEIVSHNLDVSDYNSLAIDETIEGLLKAARRSATFFGRDITMDIKFSPGDKIITEEETYICGAGI